MSKPTRWLFAEIDRWTREKIISEHQAAQLRALYPPAPPGRSWGMILFSGFGAVVIGLGVILLLAYNWTEIPKFGKLALVFGSVATAHGSALWLKWKREPHPDISEGLSLLGTMFYGAGIWLVAQIYHNDEHFPNGFLFWGLGALALAWALGSVPQAVLATLTLTIWGCTELFHFAAPASWGASLILLGIAPLAWRRRSAVLSIVLLASSYLMLASNAGYWTGSGGVFTTAFALSVGLIGGARLMAKDSAAATISRIMTVFGWLGFVVCAYLLSFEDTIRHLLRWTDAHHRSPALVHGYRWTGFAVASCVWGWLLVKRFRSDDRSVATEEWLCPIALLYCQGLAVAGYYEGSSFVAVIFNLVCLGIAMTWMVRGCREGRLRPTVLGSMFLSALVFARYFDLFDSLAVRGMMFLVLGGVLFAEGFFYRKLRIEEAAERRLP